MVRLNLLPWRAERRLRQQRLLIMASVAAGVATLMIAVASYFLIDRLIQAQEARNAFLNAEIAALNITISQIKDIEKKKADLLARMEVIKELQSIRPSVVHLLDEVVNAMPNGVFLTGIKQNGDKIILEGRAQSYGRISELMRHIQASAWMTSPTLKIIKEPEQGASGLSQFELMFQQRRPLAVGEDQGPV